MFAGRYRWWMLAGITLLIFSAVCSDYVTWLAVQFSRCVEVAGSCLPVVQFMSGTLKAAGVWLAIAILLVAAMLRLAYLSIFRLWGVLVTLWFAASAPFLLFIATDGPRQWAAISDRLPPAFLFLVALLAYLAIPFEDDDGRPFGASRTLRGILYAVALYGALAAFAETDWLTWMIAKGLGLPGLAAGIAVIQLYVREALTFGIGGSLPDTIAFAVFVAALVFGLLPSGAVPPVRRKRIKLRQLRH